MVRPNRCPRSSRNTCGHRSSRPFGAGVPVSPTTRENCPSTFFSARKRFARLFLKDESSSITSISKGNLRPA